MPVMSAFERSFCCGALWRSSSGKIAHELRAQPLGRDVLEIGAGSGSVARQLLSENPEIARVLRPGGTFLGYDLAQCARNGLTVGLRSRLVGHVMSFVGYKHTDEI